MKPASRLTAVFVFAGLALTPGVRAASGIGASAGVGQTAPPAREGNGSGNSRLTVTVGKSLIIDSPINIQRVSVANGDLVEAVAVNPKEVLINGKAAGETSLIVWQQGGTRLLYDLTVRLNQNKLEAVRAQLAREIPDQDVSVAWENDTVFLRGTVKDVLTAERALNIAQTLGKTVNLLRVVVPPPETQILLRVRFANVDRGANTDLGVNLVSTAFNQTTATTTGAYSTPRVNSDAGQTTFSFSDALNIFLFRRDINLGAAIKALQAKRQLEILAEPNVLAINGKQASFVSGGEFPFPTLQGGAGVGAVTIQFREFGVRINFLPVITPRGTIRLQVAPEVSSLDYSNGVTFQGFTIPALATRRIQTEVELESGQSFVIAGLLDNRVTEALSKIPGIGDIPLLGKLFQSRTTSRNNSELLVMVTPEVVRPIGADQPRPDLNWPQKFMETNTKEYPRTPGVDKTGPAAPPNTSDTMPYEQLVSTKDKAGQAAPSANLPPFQLIPVPVPGAAPSANPGLTPTTPMTPPGGSGK